MTERTTLLRALFIAAACGALARSLGTPIALLAITAFIPFRVGPGLSRVLAVLAYLAIASAAVVSWSLMVVLMVHGDSTELTLITNGLALLFLAVALARSERRGLAMLCATFAFLIAGLHKQAPIEPFLAVGAIAAMAVIITESILAAPRREARGLTRRAWAVIAAMALAAGLSIVLPPAQLSLERTLFSMYTPPASARSGLSTDDVRLGEVESLASSSRVALHVWAPRPLKLRARVYFQFDGRLWHAINVPATAPAPGVDFRAFPNRTSSSDALLTRVVPINLDAGLIPSPGNSLAIKTRDQVQIDPFGIVLPTRLGAEVAPYAIQHGRISGLGDPGPVDPRALSLPRNVDPRLRDVAARIVRETQNPRERVAKTIAWIQTMAHYDLEVGAFRSRDPIAEFLFTKHRGYCEYFASALALMLRLEGIPARFVTGYQVDESSREGNHFVVRDSDAHAWVEAYVEGAGWIEADATPAAEYAALHSKRTSTTWTRFRAAWADFWIDVRQGSLWSALTRVTIPIVVIALVSIFVFIVRRDVLRRRANKPKSAKATDVPTLPAVVEVVARIDRTFAASGLPRPRAHGLLEHLSLVEGRGLELETAAALRRAIDLVHRRHFGAEAVSEAALRAAAVALDTRIPVHS
jgi:transglutaminase-like putative cysteine protease